MFQVWMRLLRAVPGSVLWLLESNPFAPVNLRREAESQGVAADRLVFAPDCGLSQTARWASSQKLANMAAGVHIVRSEMGL